MEEYDFDEDDLINEYIEDDTIDRKDNFVPEEYDEIIEDFAKEESNKNTQAPVQYPMEEITLPEERLKTQPSEFSSKNTNSLPETKTSKTFTKKIEKRNMNDFLDRSITESSWRTSKKEKYVEAPNKKKKSKFFSNSLEYIATTNNEKLLLPSKQKQRDKKRYTLKKQKFSPSSFDITLSTGNRVQIARRNTDSFDEKCILNKTLVQVKRPRNNATITNNVNAKHKYKLLSAPTLASTELWVDKYSPRHFLHLLSDERINRQVLKAIREWDPYVFQHSKERPEVSKRVLLLTGGPGIGKTTLAHIIATHAGYRTMEINASDDRASSLIEHLSRTMQSNTIMTLNDKHQKPKPNCVILDEVDGIDASAMKPLVKMFQNDQPKIRRPIILIANNKYAPVLRPILPHVTCFHVHPPELNRLVQRCKHVLSEEKLCINQTPLLYQLVSSTNHDIRSCLFTLQFLSTAAKQQHTRGVVDISPHLSNQDDDDITWKDDRTDMMEVIKSVFYKPKKTKVRNIEIMLNVGYDGPNASTILEMCFLNLLYIPFVDPNMTRMYDLHELISSLDCLFSSTRVASNNAHDYFMMQKMYLPVGIAAIHQFCRTDRVIKNLKYSARELTDLRYAKEGKHAILQEFQENLDPYIKQSLSCTITDVIPNVVRLLSSGGKLNRGVSAYTLLNKTEKVAFEQKKRVLRGLKLTYVTKKDEEQNSIVKLEPEIDALATFDDLRYPSGYVRPVEVPPMIKQLLAHSTQLDQMRENGKEDKKNENKNYVSRKRKAQDISSSASLPNDIQFPRNLQGEKPQPKKPKMKATFLTEASAKAKAIKHKRRVTSIGFSLSRKKNQQTYSGSGLKLGEVITFKYQKGFTQAVRTPCKLKDLI